MMSLSLNGLIREIEFHFLLSLDWTKIIIVRVSEISVIHIYIYIYREREREREIKLKTVIKK